MQSECKGLKLGASGTSPGLRPAAKNQECQCPKAEEYGCHSSSKLTLPCLFVLFKSSKDWKMTTHIGEGESSSGSPLIQMVTPSWYIVIDTLRNNVTSYLGIP